MNPVLVASPSIMLSLMLLPQAASAAPTAVTLVDDPLAGRVVQLGNGLAQVRVAPQLGGRLLALGRPGAGRLIRYKSDWDQAKESVWCKGGSASLSYQSAPAWTGRSADGIGAVRWVSTCALSASRVQITRELAMAADSPTVHLRVTLRNLGEAALTGAGYTLRMHLFLREGATLFADEPLETTVLRSRETDVHPAVREFRSVDTSLHFAFPTADFRVLGQGFMCMLELNLAMGDLDPGEETVHTGAWTLTPIGGDCGDPESLDWSALSAAEPVLPLVVRDEPPADLPRSQIAADSYFGLCGHGGRDYFPLWQAAGVQWVRAGFGWASGEPERGEYSFEAMDALVEKAEASGVRLIGLVHGTPGWAAREGTPVSPPNDLAEWERYVEVLAKRFRGRVDVWEIWNEPDIGQFWTGTVEDYVALLAAAYRGAKRGNPDCLVMSAGLDGPGEHFLQDMVKLGAMDHCDLVGFHPYAGNPKLAEDRLRGVWRILNFHQIRKPVWVTEVGWQSGGWKTGPSVVDSEETKAAYLFEMYRRLRPLAEVVCWYVAREAGAMFGLVRPEGQSLVLNRAYHAYREAALTAPGAWALSGPDRLVATAGETSRHR